MGWLGGQTVAPWLLGLPLLTSLQGFRTGRSVSPCHPCTVLGLRVNDAGLPPAAPVSVCLSVRGSSARGVHRSSPGRMGWGGALGLAWAVARGRGRSLLLAPRRWRGGGLPWCCRRGWQGCLASGTPPCLAASPCCAPALAQAGQQGFRSDLAVRLVSILLNQKEEKGKKKKVLAYSNKGLLSISAGGFSS